MKQGRLEVRQNELTYTYHMRTQAVIPLGDDPKVIESAEILAAQFNMTQPEV